MYHSVTFVNPDGETHNSFEDWGMIPTTRPVINPPKLKTRYVEIPGMMGKIDVSDVLTRFPLYENREGDIEFLVLNQHSGMRDSYLPWHELYSKLMLFLNHNRIRIFLEDDPDFYYEGRVWVNGWNTNSNYSTVTVSYDVAPCKYYKTEFVKKINITPTSSVPRPSGQIVMNYETDHVGYFPMSPTIDINSHYGAEIKCTLINNSFYPPENSVVQTFNQSSRDIFVPRFVFYGPTHTFKYELVSGGSTGNVITLSLKYRDGRL